VTLLANKTEIVIKNIFQLSKSGNSESEYEDACDYSIEERRFAISDGATESSFANLWAKSLVTGLVATAPFQFLETEADLLEWLEPLQNTWRKMIDWQNLPWFAADKAEAGAFATLLGIQFLDPELVSLLPETKPVDEEMRWQAIAIGDSCLFQVRQNQLASSFPLNSSKQFSNSPILLASSVSKNQQVWRNFHHCKEVCYENDLFFLMTDALAQWFLTEYEQGRKPWVSLYHLQGEEDFQNFITGLRNSGQLRNDDVTLLTIQLGNGDLGLVETISEELAGETKEHTPTFIVKDSKDSKDFDTAKTTQLDSKLTDVKAPQFRSLDQPSVLKQIGKSIIGLLGKKEEEDK